MTRIAIIGAFDRYNYGDLLFPILVQRHLAKRGAVYEAQAYALQASDLTRFGAIATRPISELYETPVDAIVVAGGQVLNAKWHSMHLNLVSSSREYAAWRLVYGALGGRISNSYARRSFAGRTRLPWIPEPSAFAPTKVIFNAVGGTDFSRFNSGDTRTLTETLQQAAVLSVRDRRTQSLLVQMGVGNVGLAPDSAILLSDYFPVSSFNLKSEGQPGRPSEEYLCFQIGSSYAGRHVKRIADQLRWLSRTTDLGIVLLPIGRASGHDDMRPLLGIHKHLAGKVPIALVEEATIIDTMKWIAGSSLFVGTSLHGCLTALSYGVPCMGLNNVRKLSAVLEYFALSGVSAGVDVNSIGRQAVQTLDHPFDTNARRIEVLKQYARDNLDRIGQCLDESAPPKQ